MMSVVSGYTASGYKETEVSLVTRAGLRLAGTLVEPAFEGSAPASDNQSLPLVVMVHGVRAHRQIFRFVKLAQMLAQAGIASLRFDLSGRGQSEGNFADTTVPGEVDELEQIVAYAHTLSWVNVDRIALLGHSQGGLDVSLYAGKHPDEVAALVLMAAAAVVPDDCRAGSNPIPGIGQEYIRTGAALDVYGTAAGYRGPVCIVHGARDAIVPVSYALRYNEIYTDADLHIYGNDDHSLMHRFSESSTAIVDFLMRQLLPEQALEHDRAAFAEMISSMRQAGIEPNERVRAAARELGLDI